MTTIQQQTSMTNANTGTATPQVMKAPQQLNANAMNTSVQKAQMMGTPTAQAVNQAATNPINRYYAKGGHVDAPTVDDLHSAGTASPSEIDKWAALLSDSPALKPMKETKQEKNTAAPESTDDIHQYSDPQYLKDRAKLSPMPRQMAKGGPVAKNIGHMPLKDIVKMLAAHPDVMNQSRLSASNPMKSTDMAKGGMPTANTQGKSESRSMSRGLLTMNDDVGSYAAGGVVGEGDNEVLDNSAGMNDGKSPAGHGIIKLAGGGDIEADNIVGYDPDGTPIVQNSDGTQQSGSINKLLDRPESASTLGTGATPTTGVSKNASNSISNNQMAKGGESGNPPPGSLSQEVADNIPAQLSGGEFVFSADVVRFYGLRTLNMMMEHARDALKEMNNEGIIRHPGDNKNPNTSSEKGGNFLQDKQPNMNAYNDEDGGEEDEESANKVKGLLAECSGGYNMATGGGVGEEQSLRKGGSVRNTVMENPIGRSNMVSPHPKGGSIAQDYADGGYVNSGDDFLGDLKKTYDDVTGNNKSPNNYGTYTDKKGDNKILKKDSKNNIVENPDMDKFFKSQGYASGGVVTATSKSMFPKKSESLIPSGQAKIPGLKKSFAKTGKLPKMAQGGLLDYNNDINKEMQQSYIE